MTNFNHKHFYIVTLNNRSVYESASYYEAMSFFQNNKSKGMKLTEQFLDYSDVFPIVVNSSIIINF